MKPIGLIGRTKWPQRSWDEVFKDYLWQQWTVQHRLAPRTVFTSRPPARTCHGCRLRWCAIGRGIGYCPPDPPLGLEERGLFADTLPNVRVCTLSEWLAGEQR